MNLIIGCVIGVLCFYGGWRYAHIVVAAECERLGGFFVDKTVYRCTAIERKENSNAS